MLKHSMRTGYPLMSFSSHMGNSTMLMTMPMTTPESSVQDICRINCTWVFSFGSLVVREQMLLRNR